MSHHHAERSGKRTSKSRRNVGKFDFAQTFLIVCEGERTEPNYFRAFRVAGDVRKMQIEGTGYNTLNLVRWAVELAAEDAYDQVWCVFDLDSFPAEHFNAAIVLAENSGLHAAYSNQAFELWYLLHFHYYDTGISRQDYCRKLDELLKKKYRKNDSGIFRELESKQSDAIRNAARLLKQQADLTPAQSNPSTRVFELVEQLNRYAPENLRR
jgi:hypothetical protein